MSLLVSTAIDKMQRKLNSIGQEADDGDFKSYLQDTVDYFYQNYNLPTAVRFTDVIFYPGVLEYSLPTDFVSLISPRKPGGSLQSGDFFFKKETRIYSELLQGDLAVSYDEDTPYLVAVKNDDSKQTVNDCEETTGVTISGDGSELKADDRVYTSGSGSLQFTVTASGGTTTLTFALTSTLDITDYEPTLHAFFNLYVPRTNDGSLTDVKFRLGNDSSNYIQWLATTRFRGQAIKKGWGIIGAPFENIALLLQSGGPLTLQDGSVLSLQGTVTETAIDWCQIVINHGTSDVNGVYRIDSIFLSKGTYYELPYYSNQVIEATAGGGLKSSITETSDTILLPPKADGAVIYKCLELIAAERLKDSGRANYFSRELMQYESELRAMFPREVIVRTSSWMPQSR